MRLSPFYIASFIADIALGIVFLAIPLFAIKRFDASFLQLGYIGGFGALTYFLSVLLCGRLVDKISRKKVLISACILYMVIYMSIPFVSSIRQIIYLHMVGSVAMAMFWPSIQSWIALGLDRTSLIRALSNFNVAWCAGLMVGTIAGGFLFEIGSTLPFFIGPILMGSIALLLRRQPLILEVRGRGYADQTPDDLSPDCKKFLYIAWIANFVSWFIVGLNRHIFPRIATMIGFSPRLIGLIIFLMVSAQMVVFIMLGRSKKWHYRLGPIIALQAIASWALIMAIMTDSPYIFGFAFILMGASGGITYFSSIFYSLWAQADKGKKSGIHESFIGAGIFLGPLIGGIAAHNLGSRSPYVIALILLLSAMVLEGRILARRNR